MLEPLQHLRTSELKSLAGVLRSGRLMPPFTTLSVGRVIADRALAEILAASLQEAGDLGLATNHVAGVIDLLVADRRAREGRHEARVDLVWSGPEMRGVTDRDTPVVVHELFSVAKREVLVAGYAVYQGKTIFRPLAAAMDEHPGLAVTFFLDIQRPQGDTTTSSEIVQRFAHRFRTREWPGERLPELYYDPRSLDTEAAKKGCLHAKCIVVDEETALVSSANFTEAAQQRNIEVGVLVRGGHLPAQLREHLLQLRAAGLVERL